MVVADHSSTAKVTLWEEQVGILHEQTSYKLENFVVREWGGTKYLSMGSKSKVIKIEDIEDSKIEANDDESVLHGAQIVAVSQLDNYKVCMRCGARIEPSSDTFERCSKHDCSMLQKVDFCTVHTYAKLMLMAKSTFVTLSSHGKLLLSLADVKEESELSEEHLLSQPVLKEVTYNDKNGMTSFTI